MTRVVYQTAWPKESRQKRPHYTDALCTVGLWPALRRLEKAAAGMIARPTVLSSCLTQGGAANLGSRRLLAGGLKFVHLDVGQVVNLRPIVNRPSGFYRSA